MSTATVTPIKSEGSKSPRRKSTARAKPVRKARSPSTSQPASKAMSLKAAPSKLPPPDKRIATAIGVVMPVFSCVFTGAAGALWLAGGFAPAVILGTAGIAGLGVSLSHVAEAIKYATGTAFWPSLFLAVAFELGIVGVELGRVISPGALDLVFGYALMAGIAVLVAGLNVYAFRLHAHRLAVCPCDQH